MPLMTAAEAAADCVCAGSSPGGPCCCGVVPSSAGEEQLAGDGLEVGPQWVRPKFCLRWNGNSWNEGRRD